MIVGPKAIGASFFIVSQNEVKFLTPKIASPIDVRR